MASENREATLICTIADYELYHYVHRAGVFYIQCHRSGIIVADNLGAEEISERIADLTKHIS